MKSSNLPEEIKLELAKFQMRPGIVPYGLDTLWELAMVLDYFSLPDPEVKSRQIIKDKDFDD